MDKISSLVRKCQHDRDAAMKQHKEVKEEQAKKDLELQHLLQDLENKYAKTWTAKISTVISNPEHTVLWDEKNATSQKGEKHTYVSGDNSTWGQSHLMKDEHSKCTDMSSDFRHGDDTQCCVNYNGMQSCKCYSGSCNFKNQTDLQKVPVGGHSLSVTNSVKHCVHNNRKTDSIKWKPDKEWNNDFTGLSSKTEEPGLSEENTHTGLLNKQHRRNGSQNTSSTEQSLVKSRKGEHKIKKQSSYEPNLGVANRKLKLIRPESHSKTDLRDSADDTGLL